MSGIINDRLTAGAKHTLKLLEEMSMSIRNTSLRRDQELAFAENAAWSMDKALSILSDPSTVVKVDALVKELRSITKSTKQDQGELHLTKLRSIVRGQFSGDGLESDDE